MAEENKKEDNALYKMLGNVNYNKAYAVGQYVNDAEG